MVERKFSEFKDAYPTRLSGLYARPPELLVIVGRDTFDSHEENELWQRRAFIEPTEHDVASILRLGSRVPPVAVHTEVCDLARFRPEFLKRARAAWRAFVQANALNEKYGDAAFPLELRDGMKWPFVDDGRQRTNAARAANVKLALLKEPLVHLSMVLEKVEQSFDTMVLTAVCTRPVTRMSVAWMYDTRRRQAVARGSLVVRTEDPQNPARTEYEPASIEAFRREASEYFRCSVGTCRQMEQLLKLIPEVQEALDDERIPVMAALPWVSYHPERQRSALALELQARANAGEEPAPTTTGSDAADKPAEKPAKKSAEKPAKKSAKTVRDDAADDEPEKADKPADKPAKKPRAYGPSDVMALKLALDEGRIAVGESLHADFSTQEWQMLLAFFGVGALPSTVARVEGIFAKARRKS